MRWYAETPFRRSRQIAADALVVAWVALWLLIGRWVFDLVEALAAPADPLRSAGGAWTSRMSEVAESAAELPLVGGGLSSAFSGAGSVGDDLVAAGDGLDTAVHRVAWLMSFAIAGIPILLVAGGYLVLRYLMAHRVGLLARARSGPHASELFALRALVNRPPRMLLSVDPDPLGAWQSGDRRAIEALAALELRRWGLRPGRDPVAPK